MSAKDITEEEAELLERACKEGERSRLVLCPKCGEVYYTGRGHYGSAYCKITTRREELRNLGWVPLNKNWHRYLIDHRLPYKIEPLGRFKYHKKSYKTSRASPEIFVLDWVRAFIYCVSDIYIERESISRLYESLRLPKCSNIRYYLVEQFNNSSVPTWYYPGEIEKYLFNSIDYNRSIEDIADQLVVNHSELVLERICDND